MKHTLLRFLAAVAIAAPMAAPLLPAAEVTVATDLASAHLFRGRTLNDDWVLQPEVLFTGFPVPLEIGIWGNLDLSDDPPRLEAGQFSRLDLFADYELPEWAPGWKTFLGYREYIYPLATAAADREARLGLVLDRPLSPALALSYGLDGAIERDVYGELTLSHTWDLAPMLLDVTAGLGYRDEHAGARGFSHTWLSLAAVYPILSASITAIQRIDRDVMPDSVYDVRLVGRIGARMSF